MKQLVYTYRVAANIADTSAPVLDLDMFLSTLPCKIKKIQIVPYSMGLQLQNKFTVLGTITPIASAQAWNDAMNVIDSMGTGTVVNTVSVTSDNPLECSLYVSAAQRLSIQAYILFSQALVAAISIDVTLMIDFEEMVN